MINKRYLKITILVWLVQANFSLLSCDKSKDLGGKDLYQNLLQKVRAQRDELISIGRSDWPEGPCFYDALLAHANQGIAELKKKLSKY